MYARTSLHAIGHLAWADAVAPFDRLRANGFAERACSWVAGVGDALGVGGGSLGPARAYDPSLSHEAAPLRW